MEIVCINQHTICFLVEIINRCNELVAERVREVTSVKYEILVGFKKVNGERSRETWSVKVGLNFVYGEKVDPILGLRLVGGYIGIEDLVDVVESDAPVCFNHEFLFEPKALLEILKLCEEINEYTRDLFNSAYFRKENSVMVVQPSAIAY